MLFHFQDPAVFLEKSKQKLLYSTGTSCNTFSWTEAKEKDWVQMPESLEYFLSSKGPNHMSDRQQNRTDHHYIQKTECWSKSGSLIQAQRNNGRQVPGKKKHSSFHPVTNIFTDLLHFQAPQVFAHFQFGSTRTTMNLWMQRHRSHSILPDEHLKWESSPGMTDISELKLRANREAAYHSCYPSSILALHWTEMPYNETL